MIPFAAVLKVADNSGAKKVKMIGIPGSNKKFAYIGDVISVVIKGATSVGNVKDHTVAHAVIVRAKKETRRKDGTYIRFDDNAVVLIGKDNAMLGTRIFGPVAREIKDRGFAKVVSLAPEVW
ncbi:50S ribosomal protein L14 [candidate division WWE3 bacterium]|nr:50S ribosomal protein L14 [candidate division WWE3 bacterium]